jgi:hypothetical protein
MQRVVRGHKREKRMAVMMIAAADGILPATNISFSVSTS